MVVTRGAGITGGRSSSDVDIDNVNIPPQGDESVLCMRSGLR